MVLFDSVYHAVFACVRGPAGYPKGEAVQAVPDGLLLRPSIPSSEIFGVTNTYGPLANFKLAVRELPDQGNFRVTVKAARYDDGLLLEPPAAAVANPERPSATVDHLAASPGSTISIAQSGIYQIDVSRVPGEVKSPLSLQLDDRYFSGNMPEYKQGEADNPTAEQADGFLVVRLASGDHHVEVHYGENVTLRQLRFTRIDEAGEPGRRFAAFERRMPSLGVHVGVRRDCGSTLKRVGVPQVVSDREPRDFVFVGPINDFPSPDVEKDNVNYLAGIHEIAVRSEFTDGRDMPRLVVRSVEFEGPYYSQWPPASHRKIFPESPHRDDPQADARDSAVVRDARLSPSRDRRRAVGLDDDLERRFCRG